MIYVATVNGQHVVEFEENTSAPLAKALEEALAEAANINPELVTECDETCSMASDGDRTFVASNDLECLAIKVFELQFGVYVQ